VTTTMKIPRRVRTVVNHLSVGGMWCGLKEEG